MSGPEPFTRSAAGPGAGRSGTTNVPASCVPSGVESSTSRGAAAFSEPAAKS
jgi:hypothetical protein